MEKAQSNSNKVLAVLVVGGAIAAAAFMWPKSEPDPKPTETVQKPVEVKQPEKPVVAEVPAEQPKTLSDDEKNALLGIAKPRPQEVVQEVKRPRRIAKKHVEEDTAAQDDGNDPLARPQIGLSDADFHNTIERWRGMKSCIHTHKGRQDDARGALRISMKITGAGEVVECKVFDESNEMAKLIAPCVEKQAKQLRFPAFEGEPFAVKEAKFVF